MNNKFLLGAMAATMAIPSFAARRNDRKGEQKPNIILIMTDQQTANAMSCVGNKNLKTPNIDRLAKRGVVFGKAYCTSTVSGPSRAAMFTGHYPDEIGMIRNGAPLPDSLKTKTLGNMVAGAGYECAYAGKWHVNESSIPDGVYGFRNIHGHEDEGLAEAAVTFLKKEHKSPFFLVASFDNPHNICEFARDQNLPAGNISVSDTASYPQLPVNHYRNADGADVVIMEQYANYSAYPTIRYTEQDWRTYLYAYYRLIEKVDSEIGKIVDEIDNKNLWKNTVIIFTSDHGDGAAAHQWNQKSALYEEVVNIPLIVCAPGVSAGKSDILVSNGIDMFESVCDYAGVENSPKKGKSFRAVIENPKSAKRDYIVSEIRFDNGTTRGWMIRTSRYKYVLYDKGKNREQFFDIDNDKVEMHNLSKDVRYSSEIQRHRDILYSWMKENSVKPTRPIICDVPGKTL